MDFRILGPLEVWDRGRPIRLRRRKERALLGMLVVRAGEPVSSDELVDGLWGERPPRTARAALQNYIAQLRRALGPGVLLSEPAGYLLDVGPEQVDLRRFERLAAAGRATEGEERREKLREALALWRGPPLGDLAFEPFASYEVGRLEELRTAALEDLIDAELAVGAGTQLVEELETLILDHPFRERLRGQLMLALYRSGRQADALAAYQETRRILVEELGIEPSAPLRELEQAILRQDPSVDAPARAVSEKEPSGGDRRRTVTILLADLIFGEALDPELIHKVSVDALTRLRGVLESHGATIEQRAGDEVMAVFGVPRAHEDDVLRAARAAVELRSEIRAQGGQIELRVGIETGEVLAGDDEAGHGFISGPVVGQAKRLLQQAAPGEVLTGQAARRLLGEAVVVDPVAGARAARILELAEGATAPARHLEAPLVDREPELSGLHDAFAHAVEERSCRLLLLLGEAGIGKTRLVSELTVALDSNATSLVGHCVSYGKGATYLPLAEIVSQARERRELGELLAGDEHAELIRARLADLSGEAEAPASGGETFWAVRRLLEALALERPLILVFEDLHWAEPMLLDLIDYLTRQVTTAPILLLGLARPELLEQRVEWADNEATRLSPLSSEDGQALLENLGEVRAELGAKILRTAGGNPLFIEQLLAHATEDAEPEAMPPSLHALLASRLDRLEPGELRALQRAAVLGQEFSREAVVHLLPEGQAAGVDADLLAVVGKGLARRPRDGAFRFQHVLIREAAYASLPKAQRADLHERAASWLRRRSARSDELVGYHLEQAHRYRLELGQDDNASRRLAAEAGEHLSAAGLRAAKSGDMPAASNLLTRALSLMQRAEVVRRDLLTELGLVVWRRGEVAEAQETFDRAIRTAVSEGDRRSELRARTELAHLRLRRAEEGASEELLALASEAIPLLEQAGDDRALGRIWFALATASGGFFCQYRQASEAAGRALDYFRRSDWPLLPSLQEIAAGLYYGPTPVPEAIRRCGELLQEADRGGTAQILVYQAGLEAMADRFPSARDLLSEARGIYEDLDWTVNIAISYAAMAGAVELIVGDFAEAERFLDESCSTLEAWGLRGQLATQATQLAEALYGQGRYGDALRWSETAEACAAGYDTGAQFLWRAVRGKALARQGAIEKGTSLAAEAADLASATDSVSQRAHALLSYAEVLRLDGRAAEVLEAVEEAIVLLDEKGNVAAGRAARGLLAEIA